MATAENETSDVGGVRSPRYPSLSLKDGVAKVKAVYDADKTAGSPMQAALKHMGYSAKSGPATKAVAALKRYGLIEVRNGRMFPTQRAVTIIRLPETDKRRQDALRDAVLAPELYRELFEQYRESGLPSIQSLENELLLGNRFNHNAVPGFVADFIDSLKFAGLADSNGVLLGTGDSQVSDEIDLDDYDEGTEKEKSVSALAPPKSENVIVRDFPIPLISGGLAVIKIPVPMSESDFKQITGTLEAWKEAIVRKKPIPAADPLVKQVDAMRKALSD